MMNWFIITLLIALHALALDGLIHADLSLLVFALAWWQVTGLIGISVGLHRQMSHRAFSTPRVMTAFHLLMAALAGQAGPLTWVRVHRAHHKYADRDLDPHSPVRGFWHAHFGWLLDKDLRSRIPDLKNPITDLQSDWLMIFFERYHWPFQFLIGSIIGFWGGWRAFETLWALRLILVFHSAWIVNSVCHRFGYRNFETNDHSVNNALIALFTGGEGYHNNHHKHPRSPKLSWRWFELDLGWHYIRLIKWFGLAKTD